MSLKHIVSTRLDQDMMRELRLAARGAPVGEALRELVLFALINRHEFVPRGQNKLARMCKHAWCLLPQTSSVHWSLEEIESLSHAARGYGVAPEQFLRPAR